MADSAAAMMSPGMTPARNSAAMDWEAMIPYIRKGLLGGMSVPRAPPEEATAPENFFV